MIMNAYKRSNISFLIFLTIFLNPMINVCQFIKKNESFNCFILLFDSKQLSQTHISVHRYKNSWLFDVYQLFLVFLVEDRHECFQNQKHLIIYLIKFVNELDCQIDIMEVSFNSEEVANYLRRKTTLIAVDAV